VANPPNPPNPTVKDEEVRRVSRVSLPPPEPELSPPGPDPGDIFAGQSTRADRARDRIGRQGEP
jgi:hypothetical protein